MLCSMIRCPVCGKLFTSSMVLLKHIRLKCRFDKDHERLWHEFILFMNSDVARELRSLGKTEVFRAFLQHRGIAMKVSQT